ncbi:MAG: glutamine hydrolyzing CTP synthase [Candidatus Altarchaeaceae archaeon]
MFSYDSKVTKYIVVSGGVMSGLGKGIVAASIGKIMKSYGFEVSMIKFDGYLNVDPGTLNPYEHGEVYVLEDGTETDLDFGHYERFLNINLTKDSSITNGKIYREVIEKERKGLYLGKTVQIIPHVTNEMISFIKKLNNEVVIIEVGGTVGDLENAVFLEALRQLSMKEKVIFIHLSYVPLINGEQKTKPAQHSMRNLLELGIFPYVVIGRCKENLNNDVKRKIAMFAGIPENRVISDPDCEIYEVPLIFEEQRLGEIICRGLELDVTEEDIEKKKETLMRWKKLVENLKSSKSKEINIGIVGKYIKAGDAYLSIKEALRHCEMYKDCKIKISFIDSENKNLEENLKLMNGIIVPGGFGIRGIEGKIKAIKFCREKNIPFLGICLGFQLAVIEFARNVCNLEDANSSEIDKNCKNPVIDLIPEQTNIKNLGGTMRLGSYKTIIEKNTIAYEIYKKDEIFRRHRHRYEVNLKYLEILEKNGLKFSGKSSDNRFMEILELKNHKFFIATQYHPEFSSRPENPEELFVAFVDSCIK